MPVAAFAPAKINLYLHVVGRREDGYHLLDSLVAFADIGDSVRADPAAAFSLTVGGAEAAAVAGLGDDNLVLRAGRALAAHAGVRAGAALHLEKHLPAAAGIGGGSADAAAALRVLDALWRQPVSDAVLAGIAVELGADVPACLASRPVWVGGIGERIEPAPPLPPLGIVLANPRRPVPTPDVFRARRGSFGAAARFDPSPEPIGFAAQLGSRRNDLTEAALRVAPEIETVLDRLAGLPEVLLARMSGSGATCFALFADRAAALAAGSLLRRREPGWWSAAGALLTAPPPVRAVGCAAS